MSTATIALLFLGAVALAVLLAAGYALFGKPQSPESRKRRRQVVAGFSVAGGLLAGFVLVGALVAGIGVGFCGAKLDPGAPLSFSSRPLAFALLASSLTLLLLTVQRWGKYLGGFVGYGVLNGLLMASSGHLLNNPAVPVSRLWALTMCGIALLTALVCLRFTDDYRLNTADKTALIGWVVFFAVALNVAEKYGLPLMALGCVGLVSAWFYDRRLNRPHRRSRPDTRVSSI